MKKATNSTVKNNQANKNTKATKVSVKEQIINKIEELVNEPETRYEKKTWEKIPNCIALKYRGVTITEVYFQKAGYRLSTKSLWYQEAGIPANGHVIKNGLDLQIKATLVSDFFTCLREAVHAIDAKKDAPKASKAKAEETKSEEKAPAKETKAKASKSKAQVKTATAEETREVMRQAQAQAVKKAKEQEEAKAKAPVKA